MPRKRTRPEPIFAVLRDAGALQVRGSAGRGFCEELDMSDRAFYRPSAWCGGPEPDQAA